MPVRRRYFQGMEPGTDMGPQGGSSQQSPKQATGQMPTPPPLPIDPNQAQQGYGRGPTMPGNVGDLLATQGDPEADAGMPMDGASSVVLRLMKQLGKI